MALDTLAKRASAIGTYVPFLWNYPIPDGAVEQGDRQEIAYLYSGILSTAASSGDGTGMIQGRLLVMSRR